MISFLVNAQNYLLSQFGQLSPRTMGIFFKLKTSAVSDDEVCTHKCLIANSEGVKEINPGITLQKI